MRRIKAFNIGIVECSKKMVKYGAIKLNRLYPDLALGKSNVLILNTVEEIQNALVLKDTIDKYFSEVDFFDDPYIDIKFGVHTVHHNSECIQTRPHIVVNGVLIDVGLNFMELFVEYVLLRTRGHVCEFVGSLRNADISEFDNWVEDAITISYDGVDVWEFVDGDNNRSLGKCSIREFMSGLNEFFEF